MDGVYYDGKGNLIGIQDDMTEEIMESYDLNQWARAIHQNSVEHGWYSEPRSFGDIVALCHSELSEALEAYRNEEPMVWDNNGKPDGIAVELCDCMIRILDYLGYEGQDVAGIVAQKHVFNRTRPYKHGNKRI